MHAPKPWFMGAPQWRWEPSSLAWSPHPSMP